VVFLAACSSTTVVASDERTTGASTDDSTQADTESDGPDAADRADSDTQDEADPADHDDDRGGRDDTPTPPEVEIAEGFGLGGAEQLQGLLADCEDGNDLACDILYQISAFDSPEEDAAVTCGGRTDVAVTFCTAGIDAGEDELVFDPDSAGLERVIEACQVDGNMTACDFLYYRSPIDSEFQEVGGTCGGRVNVAVPDCRSVIDE
jgi:hypothetical protein